VHGNNDTDSAGVRHFIINPVFGAKMMNTYDISFPLQPADRSVLDRLKAAGMRYIRPIDWAGLGHCGIAGVWRGELSAAKLTRLQLPDGTTIRQYP
jgi:hypothetical protein